MKVGYARASITDQNLKLQLTALKEAGCGRIFQKGVLARNRHNFRTDFGHFFLFYPVQENFVDDFININGVISRKNKVPLKMNVLPGHRRNSLQHG